MRVAIVSDIHGNRTAFEAVLADLRQTSPDLVLHGGDLADSGSAPADVLDRIRDLGWPGVVGNTDEMLFRPESLTEFAAGLPQLREMFDAIEEIAAASREVLGEDRLKWLEQLPGVWKGESIALVHASAGSCWRAPAETEIEEACKLLQKRIVIYGHTHRPYIWLFSGVVVANAGSAGMPYDGDPRASYLLIDDGEIQIRRVEYDVEAEIKGLLGRKLPHSDWIAGMLRSAQPLPFGREG